jgi:small nuclear ribonucleoprotein F
MNVRLFESEEVIDGVVKGKLGDILIRCNNVLFIKEVEE